MPKFRISKSLRLKLVGTTIAIEVIMLSLLIFNGVRLMEHHMDLQSEHRINELRPLLSASLVGPVLEEDTVTVRETLQQFQSDEIKYIAVYNSAREIVAAVGESAFSDDRGAWGAGVQRRDSGAGEYYILKTGIQLFDQDIGYAWVEIDAHFIAQAIAAVKQQSVAIAAAEVVVSVLFLGFIGFALTRHLRDLTTAAKTMSTGDLSVRVPVNTHDEIGQTAQAFNIMAEEIANSHRSLEENAKNIQRLNETLEQRVAQRTEQLASANDELAESLALLRQAQTQLVQTEKMAALGELVAGVAHEVNTPVGVGVTAASLLGDKVAYYSAKYQQGDLTKGDFEEMLGSVGELSDMLLQNLQRAAGLISSFKQVAVDQSSDALRAFELKACLDDVLQSLSPKFKNTQYVVNCVCPEGVIIHSHPGALYQVVTNLVNNSLIHGFDGQGGGEISINVDSVDGDDIHLVYRDNGKGMAPETLDKVFDPFFTIRRGDGGSGLGMHITYNLVTQTLGGEIQCQSSPGQGVRFDIRLPVGQAAETAEPGMSRAAGE